MMIYDEIRIHFLKYEYFEMHVVITVDVLYFHFSKETCSNYAMIVFPRQKVQHHIFFVAVAES